MTRERVCLTECAVGIRGKKVVVTGMLVDTTMGVENTDSGTSSPRVVISISSVIILNPCAAGRAFSYGPCPFLLRRQRKRMVVHVLPVG